MDKKQIEGLIFYFENATDVNEGIREQLLDTLREALARVEEDEAAAARKRISQVFFSLTPKLMRLLQNLQLRRKPLPQLARKISQA